MLYDLMKGDQSGFETEEIEADPVLKLAAENVTVGRGGVLECDADSVEEAFEIFFGCTLDNPVDILPDFWLINGCLVTHPHQLLRNRGYSIGEA